MLIIVLMQAVMRTVPYYTHEVPLTKIRTKCELTLYVDNYVDAGSDEDSPLLYPWGPTNQDQKQARAYPARQWTCWWGQSSLNREVPPTAHSDPMRLRTPSGGVNGSGRSEDTQTHLRWWHSQTDKMLDSAMKGYMSDPHFKQWPSVWTRCLVHWMRWKTDVMCIPGMRT